MKTITLLQTVSAANDVTTNSVDLGDLINFSVQVAFTGSNVAGTFKLQASIDDTNFFDVPSSSQSITNSVGYLYNLSATGYRYIRASWDYSTGTGNITITVFLKGNIVQFG